MYIYIPELFWGINRIPKYIAFFALGYLVRESGITNRKPKYAAWVYGLAALFLLIVNLTVRMRFGKEGAVWFANASVGIAGMCALSLLIAQSNWIEYLGRAAMVILCFHSPIYRILVVLFAKLWEITVDTLRNDAALCAVIACMAILLCVPLYEFVVRFFPWTIGQKRRLSAV